jgi:Gram-negative bacterial TonB protein C-terminal
MQRREAILLVLAICASGAAQDVAPSAATAPLLVIAKLPPPVYPAIARAAAISGDVNLTVTLRGDGTIDAVHAVSGPPMLRDHAEELAKQTQFECRNCTAEPTPFPLTIRYAMDVPAACDHDPSYPRVAQSNGVIILTDQAWMLCDPAIDRTRAHSWKCIYLWKCGWRGE